ncbi:MAG: PrgI family protein [Eubacterium sp.]|nr:PrgI family protein [Eubacterium sp.]
MRLIPGKTKVKIEVFKHVTISDIIVGLIGLVAITLCAISSLPGRWIIAGIVAAVFALLLFRLDDEPFYVFLWNMLKYFAYPRRILRVYDDKAIKNISIGDRQAILDDFFGSEDNAESSDDESESDISTSANEESMMSSDNTESLSDSDDSDDISENESYIDALERQEKDNDVLREVKQDKKEEKKRLKELIKEENRILKSKTATAEEKDAVWLARAERSAEKKKMQM